MVCDPLSVGCPYQLQTLPVSKGDCSLSHSHPHYILSYHTLLGNLDGGRTLSGFGEVMYKALFFPSPFSTTGEGERAHARGLAICPLPYHEASGIDSE